MSSKNPQGDYDQALALKDAGNAAFKAGDLKGALRNYSRIFMHIGMNPCMNMSQMMGGGGASGGPPDAAAKPKDPLQQKTDELRLTAFNNMAAVYSKMGKWEDAKEKCSRVLKHDDKNMKALFRRGMAFRKLALYELARADLEAAKEILGGTEDRAIERELKLLEKDEKGADKEFMRNMKRQMQRAQKKKKKKMALKKEEEAASARQEMEEDANPNLKANVEDGDDKFTWDSPQDAAAEKPQEERKGSAANGDEEEAIKEQPSEF